MEDIERELYSMGLRSIRESAIYYLTREQLDTIQEEMESMEFGTHVQMAEYMVNTYCARARYTNSNAMLGRAVRNSASQQADGTK